MSEYIGYEMNERIRNMFNVLVKDIPESVIKSGKREVYLEITLEAFLCTLLYNICDQDVERAKDGIRLIADEAIKMLDETNFEFKDIR